MQHLDEGTLQAWLDHPRSGLESSEIVAIERHLAECTACAAELEALRGSDESAHSLLASGLDRAAPRPPFEDVVRRARGHEDLRRARKRINTLAWAASLFVAIGVGWLSNDLYRNARVYEATQAPAPVPERARDSSNEAAQAPEELEAVPSTNALDRPAEEALSQPPAPEPDELGRAAGARPSAPAAATAERRALSARADAEPAPATTADAADVVDALAADAASRAPDPFADRQEVAGALAPSGGTVVTGVVQDERGQPVQSAQVYVEGLSVGALTERDGRYSLVVPSADSVPQPVDLTVARIGYRTEKRALPSDQDGRVVADFRLQEQALQLQEVVVTGGVGATQRRALGNRDEPLTAAGPSRWGPSSAAEAEALIRRPLATVPGLAVRSVEAADSLVRVRQDLGDSVVLTLVQGRGPDDLDGWAIESAGAVASMRVGALLVTGTAPLSQDSLRALMREVR